MQRLMHGGFVSNVELIRRCLAQIEQHGGYLNAILTNAPRALEPGALRQPLPHRGSWSDLEGGVLAPEVWNLPSYVAKPNSDAECQLVRITIYSGSVCQLSSD